MSIDERAFAFVQEQSEGEWDDATINKDAARLTRLLREAENAAYERAASVAFSHFDPEWPGDELSRQAEIICDDIKALKTKSA